MSPSDYQRLRELQAELDALAPSGGARSTGTTLTDAMAEAAEPIREQLHDASERARHTVHGWASCGRAAYQRTQARLMAVPWSTIGGVLASGGVVGLALYVLPVPRRRKSDEAVRDAASQAQVSSQRVAQVTADELRDTLAAVAAATAVLSRRARRRLDRAVDAARRAAEPAAETASIVAGKTKRRAQAEARRLSDVAASARLAELRQVQSSARRCPVPFVHWLARKR